MMFEDFQQFLRKECVYETIYDDSEGRRILVLRELDAFAMLTKAIKREREVCATMADLVAREIDDTNGTATYIAAAIRARGQA